MRLKIKTPDTPFVPSDALIASWGGRRIIFIGYMGAGKTTIGRQLALSLGQTFYDLDWYIESRMRRTAKQLFDERGEEGFRKVEHNMLHEVAEFEDVVISCGGGAPCFYDNMDYLNRQGATVYLKAEPDVLYDASYARCCSTRRRKRCGSLSTANWRSASLFTTRPNTPSTCRCSTTTKR